MLQNSIFCLKGWCKEEGDRLFSVASSGRIRGNGHKLKYRRVFLNIEHHQELSEVAQRSCEVANFGDIKESSEHNLGQSALGESA